MSAQTVPEWLTLLLKRPVTVDAKLVYIVLMAQGGVYSGSAVALSRNASLMMAPIILWDALRWLRRDHLAVIAGEGNEDGEITVTLQEVLT